MLKKYLIISTIICLLSIALIALANWQTSRVTAPYLSAHLADLPKQKTALLLGTSPKLADGRRNLYFDFRIQAASELYKNGKVRHIIVSGDNRFHGYNEPEAMKAALIAQGIPAHAITADYAGLRTLDSILRAKTIFGQQSYIIVSQKFHNERAIYLARAHHIEAYGYNAQDVNAYAGFKTRIREYGARVKMFFDIWFNIQPKHGGESISLPD